MYLSTVDGTARNCPSSYYHSIWRERWDQGYEPENCFSDFRDSRKPQLHEQLAVERAQLYNKKAKCLEVWKKEFIQDWWPSSTTMLCFRQILPTGLPDSDRIQIDTTRKDRVSSYQGVCDRITAGGGIDWDHRAAAARGEEIVDRRSTNLLGNLNTNLAWVPRKWSSLCRYRVAMK